VDELRVDLGSITYYLDRELFVRRNLRTDPDLLDLASRVPTCPAALRRALKAVECLINMAALLLRFSFTKPDVIHVQFLPMAAVGLPFELWFLRIARRFGIKVVYTVHNLLPHDTEDRQRGRYRRIYEFMDRLICHDVSARGRLYSEFGVPLERISVIPHGPLLERVSSRTPEQARKELGISGDQCLVLWQGILRPYKGVLFLLKAWRQVCSKGVRACLAVVGPGDEELTRAVAEEVSALAISSSVRLEPRFVSIEERDNFYLAADIVVYPYSAVTTSGALMTGIGYGKAIVASRLAAFDQILRDGENALLVEYGDVDKLADALFELIREPGLRRRLGENARNSHANGPRWPEIARQTLTCYESALVERNSWQAARSSRSEAES
jgi:glycosyltransferase involved in cell wall biosynthesis